MLAARGGPTASTRAATPARARTATACCTRRDAVGLRARPGAVVAAPPRPRRAPRLRRALPGTHDFTAFTPTETDHVRFSRDVLGARWEERGDLLEFWIEADTFMRHMNRALVGTMLEVAGGRRSVEDFARAAGWPPRADGRPDRAAARPLPGLGVLLRGPNPRHRGRQGVDGPKIDHGGDGDRGASRPRQHGVVARRQLLGAGATSDEIGAPGASRRYGLRARAPRRLIGGRRRPGGRRRRGARPRRACSRAARTPSPPSRPHADRPGRRPSPGAVARSCARNVRSRGDTRVTPQRASRNASSTLPRAPAPAARAPNRSAGRHRVDCRWPERRLTVELDSYRFHQLAPRLGAGPPPRARGARPRRRLRPLHVGRCLRGAGCDDGGAPRVSSDDP